MKLRWAKEAADDLERIADYLFEETPAHAGELVKAIFDAPPSFWLFRSGGRPGRTGLADWCWVQPNSGHQLVFESRVALPTHPSFQIRHPLSLRGPLLRNIAASRLLCSTTSLLTARSVGSQKARPGEPGHTATQPPHRPLPSTALPGVRPRPCKQRADRRHAHEHHG